MRRVTTINLNSNAWQIDEDAFEALNRYLESAGRALQGNPDRSEILADIEQAIADKCQLALGPHQTVVSAEQIEQILLEMGPVSGTGDAATSGTDPGAAPSAAAAAPRRRLYRIGEGRMVAGVCTGLAAYLQVDVTWVRFAFVVLTLLSGGLLLLAYLGLAIVMSPVATTPAELAAAHGQPFSAQEVVDRARQDAGDLHARLRGWRAMRRDRSARHLARYQPPPGPGARIAGGVMLPVLTVLSAAWFAIGAIAALLIWQNHRYPGHYWSSDWYLAGLPVWIPLVVLLVIYLLISLPLAAGRRTALLYVNGGHHHGWANSWSGLLWLAVVAVLLIGAWLLLPPLQEIAYRLWHWPLPTLHSPWI